MKCCLIGESLGHSYSKLIHDKAGLYSYDLKELKKSELEAFVKSRAYDGYNVTIPYKQAIIPFLDELDATARVAQAVNTVCLRKGKAVGYNTDILGMRYMLDRSGISLTGKNVMILGSGGTGKTAYALAEMMKAASVTVVSRRGEVNYSNCYENSDVQIVINTTPVGMYPYTDISIFDPAKFPHLEAVADVIYNPLRTRLIIDAAKCGVKTATGLSMLVAQAKYSMDLFMGRRYDDHLIHKIYDPLLRRVTNIVLIGMPGSGKSSIGKAIARREGKKFIDLDAVVSQNAGMSIPEIFASSGEAAFRALERKAVEEMSKENGAVISTGGGVVLNQANYYSLKQNGRIYFIDRDNDCLATRGRPLSQNSTAIEEMGKKRLPLYREFADVTIKNDGDFFVCVDKIKEDFDHENISC